MKILNRKYNFKTLESLISISTVTKPTSSNDVTVSTKTRSISRSKTKKKPTSLNLIKAYKFHKSSSVDSLYNTSFSKTEKSLEANLKVIKTTNAFNRGFLLSQTQTKSTLDAKVKTLTSFINLHRIESTNMASLTKGQAKAKELLRFQSNRIKEDCYYLKNKVPFLREEVSQMKAKLKSNKAETKAISMSILQQQRDLMGLEDDIKKYNKLNAEMSASKESIQSTIELLKKHNESLRENIKSQKEKTKVLVHSASTLSSTIIRNKAIMLSPQRKFKPMMLY